MLRQMVANFSAGSLEDFVEGWKSLTTDSVILAAHIKRYQKDFEKDFPSLPA